MEKWVNEKKRIVLLDEIRGLAIILMVFYHSFYVLGYMFGFKLCAGLYELFMPLEPFFSCLFIGVCGFSCSLSRNNLKRGVKIFAFALAITLVTAVIMPFLGLENSEIWFGILHFLGLSLIIYGAFHKYLDKINPYWGIVISIILFVFFSGIEKGELSFGELLNIRIPAVLYTKKILVPLGIYPPGFSSADYFPLLPFIFVFFTGVFYGRLSLSKGVKDYAYKKHIPPFAFTGRHGLIVYLAHMPVAAGLGFILDLILHR